MSRDSKILSTPRSHEDAYFQKKEQELIEKLKQKEAQEKKRAGLSDALGISDGEILKTLEELGYSSDDISVLHLLPLVVVAWADGEMEKSEAAKIREVARVWGITPESAAAKRVEEWISHRPNNSFIGQSLRIIRDIEMFRSATKQDTFEHDIVALCTDVANAAGGFLGLGRKISEEERAVIDQLSRELFGHHAAATEEIAKQLK